MKNTFKIIVAAAALAAASLTAEAQFNTYHSEGLVVSNFYAQGSSSVTQGTTTNMVAANYSYGSNPNVPITGSGVFDLKPGAQDQPYSTVGGPSFAFVYQQSITNAGNTNVQPGQVVNIIANFAPILDDASLKNGWVPPASIYVTNVCTLSSSNAVTAAVVQSPAASWLGAKYGKLIGFTVNTTNNVGVTFQSFRVGYWNTP